VTHRSAHNDYPAIIAAAGPAAVAAWETFLAAEGLKASTRKLYRNRARQFLTWLESRGIGLPAVTPATVERYLDSHTTGAHERLIRRAPLRRLFFTLIAADVIASNPAGRTRARNNPSAPDRAPPDAEHRTVKSTVIEEVLPDDTAADGYLERLRWPDGITCPSCGHGHTYRLHTPGARRGLYKCAACARQFTATVGTALAGSKLGPRALLIALASLHGGASLLKASRRAGITYRTAQQLRRLIAEHPQDPLIRAISAALDGLAGPSAAAAGAQPSLSAQPPPALADLKTYVRELAFDPIEEDDEDFDALVARQAVAENPDDQAGRGTDDTLETTPPSLDEMRAAIRELDPAAMDDAPDMLDAGLVLLAGLQLGTKKIRPISRFTRVPARRVEEFARRLRASGVWTPDGKTAFETDPREGDGGKFGIELILYILVAVGMMERRAAPDPPARP
jgi:transposase-like protein